jgi:hypothetical protein
MKHAFLSLAALLTFAASARADVELPSDTLLPVRMQTTVSSATSHPEDRVLAVVRSDVVRNGRVVIPAGSEVRGHVVSSRRAGKVSGRSYLAVRFTEIEVRGRRYPLATRPLAAQGAKSHGRDAKLIGGGAGAGALVGAIADGKGGAAKGALLGGAAGTGVVLTTRGKEVVFPAGGRYRLRLSRSLSVD